ncbi:MAG: T9SS type A sorting domain-containing protein [Fluviicola sp.]|nr:T9SS type A sorting domain-containing protein [Fluviicola sp.]
MKTFSSLIILFLIGQVNLNAQTWTDVSFPSTGARINDIKEAPNGDLYAISDQGLFQSIDNGVNWTERSSHVFGIEILTIAPSGQILFEDGQYIMRLTPSNTIEYIDNYAAFSTAVPKSASMVSFSDNTILMTKKASVSWVQTTRTYISTDEGATFTEISNTLPNPVNKAFGLACFHKHRNSDVVYYVGENDSVYKTTDFGQTFTAAGSRISFVSSGFPHFSVTASGDLYALASGVGSVINVHKSTDQGATFPVLNPATPGASAFYANGNNLYTIQYGSTMSGSTDGGTTWTDMSSLFPKDDNQILYDVRVPNGSFMKSDGTFFGYYDGNYRTYSEPIVKIASDNLSISNASSGIDMSVVSDASFSGNRIAASLSGWVHYSDDNGTTWNPLRGSGGWSKSVCVLDNGTVYSISSLNYSSGLFRQDATDSTVEVFENGNQIPNGQDILETSQGTIIVSALNNMFYSTDGINFNISSNALTSFNGVHLWEDETTKIIYATTFETGETSYSDDEGVTWVIGTNPGSTANYMFKGLHGVWSATWPDGFFHSTDVQTWGASLSTSTFINSNKDNIFEGNEAIYLASEDARIYKSTDAFVTKTVIEDGIDSLLFPDFSPQIMRYFIPSTNFQGENGKLMLSVRGSLYLMDEGLASLNEVDNIEFGLYPNPATSKLTIQSQKEFSNVQLVNLQGMKMNVVVNGNTIDVSNLSSGIYVFSLEIEGQRISKRFIKQ